MSNIKAFIDYSMEDNGTSARESLYADIHDRVMSAIEAKKMELAGGMLAREETECEYDDMKELKKAKKKVKKLKEELAIMEAAMCDSEDDDDDDDSEYKEKKKKLKKAKKKVKKLKESLSIQENDEEVDPESEEDFESEEELEEGVIGDFLAKQVLKKVPSKEMGSMHKRTAEQMIDRRLGWKHPKARDLMTKHHNLAKDTNYHNMDDNSARTTALGHLKNLAGDINSIKKSEKN